VNRFQSLVAALALLPLASAPAVSLPVAEDTFTTPHSFLTPQNGRAATLLLNTNQAALLKFDLSTLSPAFNATNIVSAMLKIYVVSTRAPSNLDVFPITAAWTESVPTNTPMPTFDATPIGAASAAKIAAKRFVVINVTDGVIAALNGTSNTLGFLLRESAGQTYIASKEGPAQGPPAELEIDANLALDANGGISIPGTLSVGANMRLVGTLRQGSETGTAEPAGTGLILRRIQSTNNAAGTVVARTDTLMLQRDGTLYGWKIANTAYPGQVQINAVFLDPNGNEWSVAKTLNNPSTAETNMLWSPLIGSALTHIRCTFGDPTDLGHQTEVSLFASPDQYSPTWAGWVISTYNQ